LRFALTETPKRRSMSIYSTDLYRVLIMHASGNQPVGRVVGAGGWQPKPETRNLEPGVWDQKSRINQPTSLPCSAVGET
jgi:hypothetical protein